MALSNPVSYLDHPLAIPTDPPPPNILNYELLDTSHPQLLLLFTIIIPISTALGIGQHTPISPDNGTLHCSTSSSPPPPPPPNNNYRQALSALLTNPSTSPFLGTSGLRTRRRCWQKEEKTEGRLGCTILASYEDAKISVCGNAYTSMLCEDVATVVDEILNGCTGGVGGEWITKNQDGFLVKVYEG
ncbi:hypothetical protein BDD12DRAFT_801658 [Trichophaea hybrida]|nr:hypothetical protein BDD12DRAFT_801658 [Trichophaea hybrida]